MTALAKSEKETLERLEKIIEEGRATVVAMGRALRQICLEKLYRDEYPTFVVYVQKRWGFTVARAYQLIDTLNVSEAIGVDVSERHAREISRAPKSDWRRVFDGVHESCNAEGRKPTYRDFRRAVKAGRPKMVRGERANLVSMCGQKRTSHEAKATEFYAALETMRDAIETEIRPAILTAWNGRLGELQELAVSRLREINNK